LTTRARTGPLVEPEPMAFLENVAALLTTNPMSPAWVDRVKACLGDRFRPCLPVWCSRNVELDENHRLVGERLMELLPGIRNRLREGFAATGRERAIYQSAAILAIYGAFVRQLGEIVAENGVKVPFWGRLEKLYTELLDIKGLDAPPAEDLLGLFYQAYRCWYFPFTLIPGAAPLTARARAAIVEASLGKDVVSSYRQGLWRTMAEQPVLILGETGTGKELAGKCLAGGRFIAFDKTTRRFAAAPLAGYHVVNLSDASDALFDAELCGNVRGAFTGATEDRPGYLGLAEEGGTLVFDEFGDIGKVIQGKLLRPVENRVYRRVGDNETRRFPGRFVFSTNKDLAKMVRQGKFREDLYTRVNVLRVVMPPLRRILREAPDERREYVHRFVAETLAQSPETWDGWAWRIEADLARRKGGDAWRGNLRELRNYVRRSILSSRLVSEATEGALDSGQEPGSLVASSDRRAPAPASRRGRESDPPPASRRGRESDAPRARDRMLGPDALTSGMSLDDWTRYIVTRMYVATGRNQSETARRLGISWRRAGMWIDHALLAKWVAEGVG
jgi:DNA-binding NtrC family response regulator